MPIKSLLRSARSVIYTIILSADPYNLHKSGPLINCTKFNMQGSFMIIAYTSEFLMYRLGSISPCSGLFSALAWCEHFPTRTLEEMAGDIHIGEFIPISIIYCKIIIFVRTGPGVHNENNTIYSYYINNTLHAISMANVIASTRTLLWYL